MLLPHHSLFYSMGNLMGMCFHLRESDKEILFLHTCFCCVQRVSHPYWQKQRMMAKSMELLFAEGHQKFLICCLQMIPFYSAGQHKMKWK